MNLNTNTLPSVRAQIPNYDRTAIQTGIVHLGIGAFHRAHQAVYIDDILANDPRWGIVGASLRSSTTAQALNPQDGLYTVVINADSAQSCRVIGAIQRVLTAPDDPQALIAQMAAPSVKIVSLTITEKGYCVDPINGGIDRTNPDVAHDIAHPNRPKTAPGFLVAALAHRRETGVGPFTVLSCDNLSANGAKTRAVVLDLARAMDSGLADWIAETASFPATMVDRIVPATTPDTIAQIAQAIGAQDAWPVMTEPFGQWIIEDNFCAGRPDFDQVGVTLTDDVHGYETMKLRLLNGSHSALAYRGLLAGHTTVAEAIAVDDIRAFIQRIMAHTLAVRPGLPTDIDLGAYCTDLIARFANRSLNHALQQIAMDGSQKLPQRILATIRDSIQQGLEYHDHAEVIADWLRFVTDRNAGIYRFALSDVLTDELRANLGDRSVELDQILQNPRIFGRDLSASTEFHRAVTRALTA